MPGGADGQASGKDCSQAKIKERDEEEIIFGKMQQHRHLKRQQSRRKMTFCQIYVKSNFNDC